MLTLRIKENFKVTMQLQHMAEDADLRFIMDEAFHKRLTLRFASELKKAASADSDLFDLEFEFDSSIATGPNGEIKSYVANVAGCKKMNLKHLFLSILSIPSLGLKPFQSHGKAVFIDAFTKEVSQRLSLKKGGQF